MSLKDYMTVQQAAEELKMSRQAVHLAMKAKRIESEKVGKLHLLKRESVELYKTERA